MSLLNYLFISFFLCYTLDVGRVAQAANVGPGEVVAVAQHLGGDTHCIRLSARALLVRRQPVHVAHKVQMLVGFKN